MIRFSITYFRKLATIIRKRKGDNILPTAFLHNIIRSTSARFVRCIVTSNRRTPSNGLGAIVRKWQPQCSSEIKRDAFHLTSRNNTVTSTIADHRISSTTTSTHIRAKKGMERKKQTDRDAARNLIWGSILRWEGGINF